MRIKISGKVYRTGYRYFLKQIASRLQVSGYVYYNTDCSISVLVQGESENLDSFLNHCRQGNNGSIVESIHFDIVPVGLLNSFEVME